MILKLCCWTRFLEYFFILITFSFEMKLDFLDSIQHLWQQRKLVAEIVFFVKIDFFFDFFFFSKKKNFSPRRSTFSLKNYFFEKKSNFPSKKRNFHTLPSKNRFCFFSSKKVCFFFQISFKSIHFRFSSFRPFKFNPLQSFPFELIQLMHADCSQY